ncbi:rhodanese-related sulfurtransferase [Naumannella cuiyingiana]|uniref:Rhodanese-related sulfurtransferase n=1 Tax=Naumannella cuiyingiana TaxID=1347891 RepID=A0A7Z0DAU2_9ACTN|nr:rhodanese-like domain-containing protein [Naumannella cuiyingiana]NYI72190.1 rhodanese-related sulfurtransferase [Naumannella cuiyingiana]
MTTSPVTQGETVRQTSLFSGARFLPGGPGAPTERISARRAYQEALHGYGLLVDLRPVWLRELAGEPSPRLQALAADPSDLPWLARALAGSRPILFCAQGNASVRVAGALARLGVADVADVIGGYAAWRAAGLPLRG